MKTGEGDLTGSLLQQQLPSQRSVQEAFREISVFHLCKEWL